MLLSPLYAIEPIEHPTFSVMVLALGYQRPDEYLTLVRQDLIQAGKATHVVFDLLLCNGNTRQRYFSTAVFPEDRFFAGCRRVDADVAHLAHLAAPLFHKRAASIDLPCCRSTSAKPSRAASHSYDLLPSRS